MTLSALEHDRATSICKQGGVTRFEHNGATLSNEACDPISIHCATTCVATDANNNNTPWSTADSQKEWLKRALPTAWALQCALIQESNLERSATCRSDLQGFKLRET